MFKLYLFLSVCLIGTATNASLFKLGNKTRIKNEYAKLHKKFRAQMCSSGTENDFWEKYKEFRGNGYHVPVNLDGTLDKKTVAHFISEISNKRTWIKSEISKLKAGISFNNLEKELDSLEDKFDKHIDLKEKFYDSKIEDERDVIERDAHKDLKVLRKDIRSFIMKISFLHSFRFPVDHYAWRKRYDELKQRKGYWGKHEANKIFFARKIIQDGAQNQNRAGGDRFLRAAIDTVYLLLRDFHEHFLTENLRSDINYIFRKIRKHLKRGGKKQIERHYEWLDRTGRYYSFYDSLLNSKDLKAGQQMLEVRAKARFALKDLVLRKQKEVYEFWTKHGEIYRYLYVMDTIMYNEAGGIDGRDSLERRDIARVVINRHNDNFYSMFDKLDDLRERFVDVNSRTLKKHKWLNVLFKEGEFSFTYYFIPSTIRVFCQPMTRLGRFLRKENIGLALRAVENEKESSTEKHMRYFSRASMLGRIDMSSIWSDYQLIPEKVGAKLKKRVKEIRALIKRKKYRYRYDFTSEAGKSYKVIGIKNSGYVLSRDDNALYRQRNPHLFTFFSYKDKKE